MLLRSAPYLGYHHSSQPWAGGNGDHRQSLENSKLVFSVTCAAMTGKHSSYGQHARCHAARKYPGSIVYQTISQRLISSYRISEQEQSGPELIRRASSKCTGFPSGKFRLSEGLTSRLTRWRMNERQVPSFVDHEHTQNFHSKPLHIQVGSAHPVQNRDFFRPIFAAVACLTRTITSISYSTADSGETANTTSLTRFPCDRRLLSIRPRNYSTKEKLPMLIQSIDPIIPSCPVKHGRRS